MHIGIDASRANVKDKTGTEWYAYQIVSHIVAHPDNHTYTLYTKDALGEDWPPLPSSVTVKILRWPPRLLWTQLRLAWEMLIHPPDVLFVPAHTVPIVCPAKTVTTLHDVGFEKYADLYAHTYIGPRWFSVIIRILTVGRYGSSELDYHRWSARLAIKKAQHIITVSQFSKKEIVKTFHLSQNRVHVIPCGYNKEYERKYSDGDKNIILEKYAIPGPYFFFVGRLEEKKNITGMLEAYKMYREKGGTISFVLAGKPGYGYERFQDRMQSPGVIALGWVPDEDMPILMTGAEAFVFVTAYEGFGIPILEAMAAGTPVITSDRTANKETAGNAALLSDPSDSKQIAKHMHNISSDPKVQNELIEKGKQHIQQYSWSRAGEGVKHILTGLGE